MDATLKKIDAAVLFVSDLERAKRFYRDTLGLEMQFEDASSAAFQLQSVLLLLLTNTGAVDLLSGEAVAAEGSAGATSQLVSFVEDVDAAYTDLSAKGVEFIRVPTDRDWGLRTAHFKDPDGNVWELAHPLKSE